MGKNREIKVKKLNEDDILEILIEYFQENEFGDTDEAKGLMLGTPGKDLRFVGIFAKLDESDFLSQPKYDLEKLDKEIDFNGDHSLFESNP